MSLLADPLPPPTSSRDVASATRAALERIPPLWPLKSFVAVNPFVGLAHQPFADACALLQRVVGSAPLQSLADYRRAYQAGIIGHEDLAAAADETYSVERLLTVLDQPDERPKAPSILTVADLLDREHPNAHWSAFVVEEISKWCSVHFDENQTTWNSPWRRAGVFEGWREAALHDCNPEVFGLTGFRAFVARLPTDADACIAWCVEELAPPTPDLADFFHRQLATISGWAAYVQYLVREDAIRGKENPALRELLAVRLAYDAALFHAFSHDEVVAADWKRCGAEMRDGDDSLSALVRWQYAYEHGYQLQLARDLVRQPRHRPTERPSFQAVFCIDVRSEIFRRNLEAVDRSAQTIGFAGFFGFPLSHATATSRPGARCPVLLIPTVESREPASASAAGELTSRRIEAGAWKAFQNSATSCFSFVETAGLGFVAALGRTARSRQRICSPAAPSLTNASTDVRAQLAAGALRNMSLSSNFSRLILLCGHGSESSNNPYASALDCGACGGHAGDVNARVAAATLNDPAVRVQLSNRGIEIPADTVFLAGLHHTGTDNVELFDLEEVPATHREDVRTLRAALARAGAGARRERAAGLGLSALRDGQLDAAVRRRMRDVSEVRPEWGLANNAALVAAPRSRTASLRLDGRVFLHDYDASADPDNHVLTLILCAPVIVASWINLQYYGSRVDPLHYASGNKVLHNIVGGIGVLEGNGGDLKVGLPLQSIHNGRDFVHEPRRLSVFVEAARARIDSVLMAQPAVKQLCDHGWIHLLALEDHTSYRYTPKGWRLVAKDS